MRLDKLWQLSEQNALIVEIPVNLEDSVEMKSVMGYVTERNVRPKMQMRNGKTLKVSLTPVLQRHLDRFANDSIL